jgi:predicted acyltransferase
LMTGFAAHWQANSNLAWAFDRWWLNLFPRTSPFLFNGGGYATLSFIPTLGTQIIGLLAGQYLLRQTAVHKLRNLILAAAAAMILATILDLTGICPSVKRIWTPSWVLWSGGCCVLAMTFFYWLIDLKDHNGKWVFPLQVVGMNSIAFYCMSDSHFRGYVANSLKIHFGQGLFNVFGQDWAPLIEGLFCLTIFWGIAWWMWKKRLFIKV